MPRSRSIREIAGTGWPVWFGCTERLEFVDAPGHVDDLKLYRTWGYRTKSTTVAIIRGHDADLIEIHPPSRGSVDPSDVTVERCPPTPAMGY
jgi:hypothetical protein